MFESTTNNLNDCDFNTLSKEILNACSICMERMRVGKANDGMLQELQLEVNKLDAEIEETAATGNHIKDIYKNIQSYSIKHQERVRSILDLAIMEAGSLVPDADVEGIRLNHTENKRVTVVNGKGQDINQREGSGYRAILGALLRYACAKAQPDALQIIFFDEYFFTLSDTTTVAMKSILEAMKKDITIVCIEQRRNAVDGIVDSEFTFAKDLSKESHVTQTL